MKKTLLLSLILFLFIGCRRKDYFLETFEGEPSIELNGDSIIDVNFGSNYSDMGATATDKDGNELVVLVDYNGFTTSKAKTFTINYSATDGDGVTLTVSRIINVVLEASNLASGYSVQSDCNYSIPSIPLPVNFFRGSANVVQGASSTQLQFQNIDFAGGSDIFYATIDGRDIIISGTLTISPVGISTPFSYEFNGTGDISEDARTITIDYIWENVTPLIGGGIGSCIAIYSKI